ncbi:hypothetical protein CVT24_013171 [Panaeolus cyanescens]|uniref:Cation-transporting P-type ATPase N-terminal domain-containing protein n=1 Tax=Panaeolus cyanescens TaxID=181874 RepID=A0A409VVZ1_9AGAR|nr:hypothetical protein CVT24_013171 [Panaeolus cyanescens]
MANRLPIEYRTLSIHVETRTEPLPDPGEKKAEKRTLALKDLTTLDWHKLSTEEVLNRLGVSPKTGLEKEQAARRQQQHGKNVISPPKSHLFRKIMGWLFGGFGSLLLAASIVCFIAWKPLGEPSPLVSNLALAIVLLIVLLVQALFNAWQDFSMTRMMSSIRGMLPADVLVLRDSGHNKIPAKELVPGDIVTVNMGDKIPADIRLIETSGDLQFDRSVLTGESEPISGQVKMTDENFLETRNIALQGTHCVNGSGVGVVIQTGDRTVFGTIASLSSMEQSRLTTLQRELLRFVVIIASLATLVAVIMVILWAAWIRHKFPGYINVPTLLIDVVAVMVAFIPEGLPVAVTLSLAKVANTLSKRKILCKSLSIVETLGSVNVLCSDKTGTLTQNIMHVENIAILDTIHQSDTISSALSYLDEATQRNVQEIVAVGAICNAAKFDQNAPVHPLTSKKIVGNATDVAVLRFSDSIAAVEHTRGNWTGVYRKNFNSKASDKYMLQLSRLAPTVKLDPNSPVAPLATWDNFTSGCFLLTVKGAPEVLLSRCSYVINPAGGPPLPLSQNVKDRIIDVQERWSSQGQRVILLARRVVQDIYLEKATDYNSIEFADAVQEFNSNLVIVGLVGLIDPLKPDIKQTVSVCRGAGIRFFIVTGDHPSTALSIAAQAGIITDSDRVHRLENLSNEPEKRAISVSDSDSESTPYKSIILTGQELIGLSTAQIDILCQYEEVVFARTTPEQKLSIVNNFKARGNVVAVTGDGVNDAPSLKAADCGVAMGDGSDVAKEAADLILLGEFSSIITAIEWGRLVYDNLKKTVLYLLPAGSFSELMPIVFNIVLGLPQILSNFQMIIICVATDVLPALSLCMEPPEQGLLLRKPRNVKTDRLADWRLLLHAYGFLGVLESLCAMSMAFWYLQIQGHPFSGLVLKFGNYEPPLLSNDPALFKAQSIYFFTLVIMQWGNLLATRGRKLGTFQHTIAKNWLVIPAALMALSIGIFFSYIPVFQKVFSTDSAPAKHFFIPMSFALGLLGKPQKAIFRVNLLGASATPANSSQKGACYEPVTRLKLVLATGLFHIFFIEVFCNMSDPEAQNTRFVKTTTRDQSDIVETPVGPHISTTAHRLPIEYRTLSIHVETKTQPLPELGEKKVEKRTRVLKDLSGLDWHKITIDEALTRLGVSPKTGLEKEQASRRQQQHGKNVITPPKTHFFRKLMGWIFGGFGTLLMGGSILCFVSWKPLGEPEPQVSNLALAVVLLAVLAIQATFNAWQDFSMTRIMSSIKGMLPADVLVLRDSGHSKIPAKDLVPGDIVTVSMGDKVPADLKLIEVSGDLQFDRSVLTGESEPIAGHVRMTDENFLETRNIALQGTHCVNGSCVGVVIQTGDNTVFGAIASLSSMEQSRLTTLQKELLRFVLIIAGLATSVSTLLVILWAAWIRRKFPNYISVPNLLIDIVSVSVAFIPEGLPVSVTLSLAKVARTLAKQRILCKSLSIVETLGSVNVLCSDKTGTLTQNIMHVENVAIFDTVHASDALSSSLSYLDEAMQHNVQELVAVGAICNAANFDQNAPVHPLAKKKIVGNATGQFFSSFQCWSIPITLICTFLQTLPFYASQIPFRLLIMHVKPGQPFTERASTPRQAHDLEIDPQNLVAPLAPWDHFTKGSFLLTVKGAPEVLIHRCSYVLNPAGGPPLTLSERDKDRLIQVQERWSSQGQRVILLARRVVQDIYLEKSTDYTSVEFGEAVQEYNNDLIIVGLVGLIDPLKPDIKQTVSICRGAGIRFFIVTGDHPSTALSIAAQAGIITNPDKVHRLPNLTDSEKAITDDSDSDGEMTSLKSIILTGRELTSLTPTQYERLCQYEEIVFARTTPEQKLSIVNNFKARGNVVAVTGDGVNDAPSLKAADCGVAMGDGSDVAKEAADLILLGEFSSIITAIEWGRLVFDNLKKSVLYLLPAGSFSELTPILLNVILGLPQILSNFQMIIICVGTDVLPALSMCMEPPEQGLLLRKPRNIKKDRLADWKLLLHAYGFLGMLESICASSMAFLYLRIKGHPFSNLIIDFGRSDPIDPVILSKAQSVYMFTLVIMQWGNLLATRGRRLGIMQHRVSRNWLLFPAALLALCIGIFFSYIPPFQEVFGTNSIPAQYFFIPLGFAIGLLGLDEIRKLVVRKYPTGFLARIAW